MTMHAIPFRPLALGSLLIASLLLTWFAGGPLILGQMALSLNQPKVAAGLLNEPYWQGIALYRQGRYLDAAEAFRQAGPSASFNRGNALAQAGHYADALAAFDAVIARDPTDQEARENHALIKRFYNPPIAEAGPGEVPSDALNNAKQGPKPKWGWPANSHKEPNLRPGLVKRRFVANRQWLATLDDEPGLYLRARIAAEHQRRATLGLSPPPPEDPR